MDPFAPRDGVRLDYWFWKFHVGGLGFLVDLIVRRDTGHAEVRVSQWLDGVGRVVHDETGDWSASPGELRVGGTVLQPGRCVGGTGDIAWDLSWVEGAATWSTPVPGVVGRLQPFDTTLIGWPEARFSGSITVGDRRFDVSDVPGAFYHYWGRRLADRWVWLSATRFEEAPGRRVEGLLAVRGRAFGAVPIPMPLSILWTTDGTSRERLISGINAVARAKVTATGVSLDALGITGRRHRMLATWGPVAPNDIGEGIIQTMHADLSFDGLRAVPGTVGLEVRGYPGPARANR